MKKKMTLILLAVACLFVFIAGCGGGGDAKKRVVIFSSAEEFRNEYFTKRMKEQFPDYDVVIQYHPSGNNAAKVISEGTKTEADIVLSMELNYLLQMEDVLEDLSKYDYDTSNYLDETKPLNNTYLTWERFSGAIIINRKMLEEKGLSIPTSYEDLLKSEYKGLISMPNPKASSTGYIFIKSLVNAYGEKEALAYFDKLSENIQKFTSSGSGPVNDLVQGETAIGLGMIFQAVQQINEGADLEILVFDPGSPYSLSGVCAIKGRLDKPEVKEVFDFLANTILMEDKERFSPEIIFKDQVNHTPNYPQNVKAADMEGVFDIKTKERILEQWEH